MSTAIWPDVCGAHESIRTRLLGEYIGENLTSTLTPLPARGIYIMICGKCGCIKTVPKAEAYQLWQCTGWSIAKC